MNFFKLIDVLGKIKDLKRSGWIKRNVSNSESDADHMFSVAFLAMILSQKFEVNRCHCLELALTHDLMEIIAGDAVPGEKTKKEKYADELKAMQYIAEKLDMPQLVDWFVEFETCETQEAKLVKACDKLDAVFMAAYYDGNKRSPNKVWNEFSASAYETLAEMDNDFANYAMSIIKDIKK